MLREFATEYTYYYTLSKKHTTATMIYDDYLALGRVRCTEPMPQHLLLNDLAKILSQHLLRLLLKWQIWQIGQTLERPRLRHKWQCQGDLWIPKGCQSLQNSSWPLRPTLTMVFPPAEPDFLEGSLGIPRGPI